MVFDPSGFFRGLGGGFKGFVEKGRKERNTWMYPRGDEISRKEKVFICDGSRLHRRELKSYCPLFSCTKKLLWINESFTFRFWTYLLHLESISVFIDNREIVVGLT